jgi:hypothetical protein
VPLGDVVVVLADGAALLGLPEDALDDVEEEREALLAVTDVLDLEGDAAPAVPDLRDDVAGLQLAGDRLELLRVDRSRHVGVEELGLRVEDDLLNDCFLQLNPSLKGFVG